ncbi:hypothetical protein DFH08DRAFT_838696, partial [Mycena albidolilacea]
MPFDALDEDILLNVLSLCDVYTTLSVSAVNQSLRRVACVKQLWLSLVHDLAFRGSLELAPAEYEGLEGHSTTELMHLVMRGIQATRLPARATLPHHRLAFLPSLDQSVTEAKLLRGARYTVLRVPTHLHVYEVWSGRHIWTQAIEPNTRYSADIARGSDKVRVLLTPETGNISLQEVDLATGQSWEVLTFNLPPGAHGSSKIVDDFFVCVLHPHENKLSWLLVNWPAATCIILDLGTHPFYTRTKLRPGYILQAYPESTPPHQLHLAVTDLRSLSPHLKPLHEFNLDDRLSLQDIAFTAHNQLEYDDGRPILGAAVPILSVVPCMLHRDSFFFGICAWYEPPPPRTSLAARFRQIITWKRPPSLLTYQMYSYRFTPASSGKSCEIGTPVALNRQFTRRVRLDLERQQVNGREETVVVVRYYNI